MASAVDNTLEDYGRARTLSTDDAPSQVRS